MTLDELRAGLADLDRAELRQLAWDALLRSDGPERLEGDGGRVHTVRVNERPVLAFRIFASPE